MAEKQKNLLQRIRLFGGAPCIALLVECSRGIINIGSVIKNCYDDSVIHFNTRETFNFYSLRNGRGVFF